MYAISTQCTTHEMYDIVFGTKMAELDLSKSVGKFRNLMALQISVLMIIAWYLNFKSLSVVSQSVLSN